MEGNHGGEDDKDEEMEDEPEEEPEGEPEVQGSTEEDKKLNNVTTFMYIKQAI